MRVGHLNVAGFAKVELALPTAPNSYSPIHVLKAFAHSTPCWSCRRLSQMRRGRNGLIVRGLRIARVKRCVIAGDGCGWPISDRRSKSNGG